MSCDSDSDIFAPRPSRLYRCPSQRWGFLSQPRLDLPLIRPPSTISCSMSTRSVYKTGTLSVKACKDEFALGETLHIMEESHLGRTLTIFWKQRINLPFREYEAVTQSYHEVLATLLALKAKARVYEFSSSVSTYAREKEILAQLGWYKGKSGTKYKGLSFYGGHPTISGCLPSPSVLYLYSNYTSTMSAADLMSK